jgi:hypothetical protein
MFGLCGCLDFDRGSRRIVFSITFFRSVLVGSPKLEGGLFKERTFRPRFPGCLTDGDSGTRLRDDGPVWISPLVSEDCILTVLRGVRMVGLLDLDDGRFLEPGSAIFVAGNLLRVERCDVRHVGFTSPSSVSRGFESPATAVVNSGCSGSPRVCARPETLQRLVG